MPTIRIRADWDGDSDGTTKTATGTTLKVGLDGTTIYRAALRFPLTALPASADVNRVELEVTVTTVGGTQARWDVHPYLDTGQGDPSTDNAATVYSSCVGSTVSPFIDDTFLFRGTGRHRLVLGLGVGASACTVLEAAKAAGTIFTLGLHEQTESGDDVECCELEALEHDDDGPAELIVTYNETTGITTLLAALAQRIDRTRYVSGTLDLGLAVGGADATLRQRDSYWDDHWILIGGGTGALGAFRQIKTWTLSTYSFTFQKDFDVGPGPVAYELFPFPPDLAVRAINESISELFPAFVYLPYEYECLVVGDRRAYYDLPSGMAWVGEVDWRAAVNTPQWYPLAFERVSDGQIRIAQDLPTSAKVLRLRGRQQLTKFDYADPLTLTEVTEAKYPSAQDADMVDGILIAAELKLHEWLFADFDKIPPPGSLPPATYTKLTDLRKRLALWKMRAGRRGRRMSDVRSI